MSWYVCYLKGESKWVVSRCYWIKQLIENVHIHILILSCGKVLLKFQIFALLKSLNNYLKMTEKNTQYCCECS